jgi:hypothetical protein
MKIAVIGSRKFNDYLLLKSELDKIPNIETIISGGAKGADILAEQYAIENNIELIVFKADWARYGRAAGPIRNKEIINASDYVVAFWDGKSKGTLSSINIAKNILSVSKIKIVKI